MHVLYNIAIALYSFAIRIASLFNPKAKDWVTGRADFWSKLPDVKGKKVFWFHCASLGEFDQGLPLMNLLKKDDPELFLMVTFFSPSGFNHYHKRQHSIDFACYLPSDSVKNARKFVAHFHPQASFFVKYEFWSNYIFALKNSHFKIYSISTLLRPNHRFFKWYGGFFRKTLKQFDYFFVQNELTKELLKSIGILHVLITGDTRFDRVIEHKNSLPQNDVIANFVGSSKNVLICGSTWPVDEELLMDEINSTRFEKIIIAPHQIDSEHVKVICAAIRRPFFCISEYYDIQKTQSSEVLILDSIGQLSSAYAYAQIAYVGGGFTGKLHNILEPAVFGLPVIFGPKHIRFPEASAFIEGGFGFEISDKNELPKLLDSIIEHRETLSIRAIEHVAKNAGASEKILKALSKL